MRIPPAGIEIEGHAQVGVWDWCAGKALIYFVNLHVGVDGQIGVADGGASGRR